MQFAFIKPILLKILIIFESTGKYPHLLYEYIIRHDAILGHTPGNKMSSPKTCLLLYPWKSGNEYLPYFLYNSTCISFIALHLDFPLPYVKIIGGHSYMLFMSIFSIILFASFILVLWVSIR
jgi:hypothetical protein